MAFHRRSFALIVVLIVTSAIFALAMQGGLLMRLATIETVAVRDQSGLLRDARSAAAMALVALTSGGSSTAVGATGGGSTSAAPGEAPGPTPTIPELPPEVRDLLAGALGETIDDANKPINDNGASSTSAFGGRGATGSAYSALRAHGLPSAPVEVQVRDRRFAVSFIDGGGLLNLNIAPEEQLIRYFALRGYAEPLNVKLAQELADWRDDDDFVRPRGAEKNDYQRRGIIIRNGPLLSLEELLFLPSMTREILSDIRSDVTLAGDGEIHAGSASRQALLSIPSMTATAVDQIIQLRQQGLLTKQTLTEALSPLSREAEPLLRLTPTSTVRFRVQLMDSEMAPFIGSAIVTNSRGIESLTMRRP